MKKMLIPALLISSAAMANVADLNYQPKQGSFHLDSNLAFIKTSFTQDNSGSKTDCESKNTNLDSTFSYGISDNLSAGIKLTYDFIATTETDDDLISKENGMEDPVLGMELVYLKTNDFKLSGETTETPYTLDYDKNKAIGLNINVGYTF